MEDRERELEREIHSHLEVEAEDQLMAGVAPEEAPYAARRAFGNVSLIKEATRDAWGWASVETWMQDARFGLRILRRNPLFSCVAVVSLALGIGANTAIFSLIDAVLFKLVSVKDPRGLVFLGTEDQGRTDYHFYFETYQRLETQQSFFAALAAFSPVRLNVNIDGQSEPSVEGQLVSGNYYDVLGVGTVAGRAFTEDDNRMPGGHPVAIISYAYWQRRFGLSDSAIGKKLWIDGTPFTIVGVTPPGFFGLEVGSARDITVPLMMQPQVMPDKENRLTRPRNTTDWLGIVGRLRPGVSMQQASAGMRVLYRRIQTQLAAEIDPDWQNAWLKRWAEAGLVLVPGGTGLSDLRGQFSQPLFVLMGIVGLLLLIASTNVASLLVARASARQREIAVRLAIGAGQLRLVRQLLVESVLLSCLGGAVGLLLAFWGSELLVGFLSAGRAPIRLDLTPDLRVLGFAFAASVATGILFGLAPATRASGLDLTPALKEGGYAVSGHQRLGKALVVSQVALSLVLLICAGLFIRSLEKLNGVDPGFRRDRVLTVRLEPKGSDQKRGATALRLNQVYLDLQERVRAVPGVVAVSLAGISPTTPMNPDVMRKVNGQPVRVQWTQVYPNYFATLGARILQGRDFGGLDMKAGAPCVVVINETLARHAFPAGNPLGKEIVSNGPPACEIIGVVTDVAYSNLKEPPGNAMYHTYLQGPTGRGQMVLHIRFAGDADRIAAQVRREVAGIDPNLPAFEMRTLEAEVDAALIRERLLALLATLFGALAVSLAAVGLYGVIAYTVGRRTKEIGIRMAMGASRTEMRWLVLSETLGLSALGILLGLPVALVAPRLIASFLYGVTATDPLVLVPAVTFLVLTGLTAGYFPARRASRIDPMTALRHE